MSFDLRIGAIALGALLLLAALLALRLLGGRFGTRGGTYVRSALALAGAALIVWALASYTTSRPQPTLNKPAAAVTPERSTVDLVASASSALQDCPLATPPSPPDGATATLKQMEAARTAFQAYDGANNNYLHCVDSAVDRIAKQYATLASQEDLASLKSFGTRAHDTAVDQEQAVADQFNSQIRTYKAKHRKS